jgi:5-methylcytosine-specific restriction enzyme A
MARLKAPPNRLAAMPPRLAAPKDEAKRTAYRAKVNPWRKWYNTKEWQRLRWSVLKRDLFICQLCGTAQIETSKMVADHIRPHRGNPALFWDDENIWAVDAECHNTHCQSIEARHGDDLDAVYRDKMAIRARLGGGI